MEVQFTQILEEELYIYQNTNWIVALKDSSGRIKSLYLFASIDFVRKLQMSFLLTLFKHLLSSSAFQMGFLCKLPLQLWILTFRINFPDVVCKTFYTYSWGTFDWLFFVGQEVSFVRWMLVFFYLTLLYVFWDLIPCKKLLKYF